VSARIGSIEVVPLLDAVGTLAELEQAYPGVAAEEWAPYRALYPELFAGSRWRLPVKVQVVRTAGTTILVDTGVGPPGSFPQWRPEREGLLPDALDELGIERDAVDLVFVTHLHIDHIGWTTDERGEVLFPSARYLVHREALAFARTHADRPHIRRSVEPLVERFELLDTDTELAPGVSAFVAPGHYPGHMGVRIRSNGAEAVMIVDVAPHPALLDRPEWVYAFDDAPQTTTRGQLIAELVDHDVLAICGHYPGSGVGRIVSRDGRVVWEESPNG
jgi:glyoxylase-like metal-dependent hydrolase (beta-lactamase superfamily II)